MIDKIIKMLLKLIFSVLFLNIVLSIPLKLNNTMLIESSNQCNYDYDCGLNGLCKSIKNDSKICICNSGYISKDSICDYKKTDKLLVFLLSFFVGSLGVDWFILAKNNAGYIVAGVFKLLTCGGFGIWWLVDWIRILTNSFNDGNGYPLLDW